MVITKAISKAPQVKKRAQKKKASKLETIIEEPEITVLDKIDIPEESKEESKSESSGVWEDYVRDDD